MEEQACALEVREELVTEADALARAFDQSGHVCDRQLAPVRRVDRPEHRRKRRERVLRHLGPRIRDAREQRRLARVRKPRERGIRHQLEPQLERRLLPRQARFREAFGFGVAAGPGQHHGR